MEDVALWSMLEMVWQGMVFLVLLCYKKRGLGLELGKFLRVATGRGWERNGGGDLLYNKCCQSHLSHTLAASAPLLDKTTYATRLTFFYI